MKKKNITVKSFLLLVLLVAGLCTSSGCSVQQASLADEIAIVEITYEQPEGESPVGIRTTIAGTGERVTVNDYGFADEEGRTTIKTSLFQRTYVVGRSARHDAGYGYVEILEDGETYSVESLVSTSGTTSDNPPMLEEKTPGEAYFIFVSQDWPFGEITDVKLVGEEANFVPENGMHQLYDDGTNGDLLANDGVWSLRMSPGGDDYGYGFVINGHTDTVYRDPHEEHSRIYINFQGFQVYRSVIALTE